MPCPCWQRRHFPEMKPLMDKKKRKKRKKETKRFMKAVVKTVADSGKKVSHE